MIALGGSLITPGRIIFKNKNLVDMERKTMALYRRSPFIVCSCL
jgi:hypothetical protein